MPMSERKHITRNVEKKMQATKNGNSWKVFWIFMCSAFCVFGCAKKLSDRSADDVLRKALQASKPNRCFTYKCTKPFNLSKIGPVIIDSKHEAHMEFELSCTMYSRYKTDLDWGRAVSKEGTAKFGKNADGEWLLVSTYADTCWDRTHNIKVHE